VLGPWADALTAVVVTRAGAGPGGPLAAAGPGPLAVELPAAVAAAVVAVAVVLARSTSPGWALQAAAPRAAVVALLVVPVLVAVDGTGAGAWRAGAVLLLGAALALLDRARDDERLGLVLAATAGVVAALRGGPEPVELPLVLVGLVAAAVGARRLHRDPTAGSWATLGVPVALTVGAPLVGLLVAATPWRATTTLVLALVATLAGAVRRLQAPFVLGAGAALAAAAVLLIPVTATALARVDGWVLLAVGGTAVLALGLTYERRVREAREAVRVVAAMR
ncbi:SCO7613 C-terminal domain-containing membrane protein, partial [Cellulomonas sp. 179-A 9B4 NHS]|uniref:SCO7613 C-terminal domain-containing membrane protein n=1 Tax=Cellulomonas sp. 179-A 9B4 NHS TaxID=3142379 RepID=UPI00399EEE58